MRLTRRGALAGAVALGSGCVGSSRFPRIDAETGREEGATGREDAEDGASSTISVGFVGDLMLGRTVDEVHRDGDPADVWGSMAERLAGLDATVGNLECVLSTNGRKRPGRTYHFRADPAWAIPALRAGGVRWVSLANNHVLDYGVRALRDTRTHLDRGDIAHAGAGDTPAAAREPSLVAVGDRRIAFVAVTDQSPSYAAGNGRAGTHFVHLDPRDPLTRLHVRSHVSRAAALDPDLLVVSLHWGPNWEPVPASRYRRLAHLLCEAGADVVHGHSAHVFQGVERYRGSLILHDCGDFVDDYVVKESLRNDLSALFEVTVSDGALDSLRIVPVEIRNERVERAGEGAREWIGATMRERSRPFGTASAFREADGALVVRLR